MALPGPALTEKTQQEMLERICEIADELADDWDGGPWGGELSELASELWASLEEHGYQSRGS
jgi:hypothetical protein